MRPFRVQADGHWVGFAAAGVQGAPMVEGASASVPGPVTGSVLEYEATPEGVKETIVLTRPPAAGEELVFDFHVSTSPGVVPVLTAEGGLRFLDDTGEVVFVSPPPFMVDSAAVSSTGGEPAVSTDVSYQLAAAEGGGWSLRMTPDPGWLADPARVYPVLVDPTVTQNEPDRDCWLNEQNPTASLCGANVEHIRVGRSSTGYKRRGLLDFVIPSSIPTSATIDDAQLGLYLDATQSLTSNTGNYVARQVLQSWTGAVTWLTRDGSTAWTDAGGTYLGETGNAVALTGTVSGYKYWNVTQIVGRWVNQQGSNPNYGFLMKQATETSDNALGFYSKNHADTTKWPKLTISYTAAAAEVFEKIGAREFFTFEDQALNDRLTTKVNVGNGNLLVSAGDLSIAGTGVNLEVGRHYNSLSTDTTDIAKLSAGWSMSGGPSERLLFPQGGNNRVVFQHGTGYRVQFDKNTQGGYVVDEPGLRADLKYDAGPGEYRLEWFSKDKWVFNTSGQLVRRVDKNGNTVSYTRDSVNDGRLTKITDTRGREVTFTYSGTNGLLTHVTDVAGGRTLRYNYTTTSPYRLTETWIESYGLNSPDANLNAKTLYGYDTDGRLTTVTDPRGQVTTIGYVGTTRRVAIVTRPTPATTNVGDSVWTYTYSTTVDTKCDNRIDVTKQTEVNGPRLPTEVADVTTFCFDTHDRSRVTYDAKGHKRRSEYGTNSNVIEFNESGVTGPGAPVFGYAYDNNNLTEVKLPSGGTSTAGYADTGKNPHLPTSVHSWNNSKTGAAAWVYDYDDNGNLIEAVGGASLSTFRYCYDGRGLLTRIDAHPVTVALDTDLGASCPTSTQNNDTLLTYNTTGELVTVDEPGTGRTTTLTYDPLSRVKTSTDGRGAVATYTYDAHDRILAIDYTEPAGAGLGGVNKVTYAYDVNGNLTARTDATGTGNFTYDELNRMTKETPEAPVSSTTYTYDEASNLKTTTSQNEPGPVSYTYDKLNLATTVVDQKTNQTTFGYNDQDRRITTSYPNGVTMKSKFDNSARLLCIYAYTGTAPTLGGDGCPSPSTSLLTLHKYTFVGSTGLDTPMRYTETDLNNHQTAYTYDVIQRLKTASTKTSGGTGTETRGYTYKIDARDNITEKAVTGSQVTNATTTLAYADNNELCWTAPGTPTNGCASPPSGATTYTHDAAGNMTGSTATTGPGIGTATYNKLGQTTTITPPGTTSPMTMEYADVTSDRRTLAGPTRMAYSILGLTAQGPNNGNPHAELFVRDPSGTLTSRVNGGNNDPGALYYLYDGLGSVVATTNQTGTIVERYTYDPYGDQLNPNPTDTNPWRYAAGYHDTATGLTKFGTRYHNPTLTRWTQVDPIAGTPTNPLSLNPYSYVLNNPCNGTDPTGRCATSDVFTGMAAQVALLGLTEGALALGSVSFAAGLPVTGGLGAVIAVNVLVSYVYCSIGDSEWSWSFR